MAAVPLKGYDARWPLLPAPTSKAATDRGRAVRRRPAGRLPGAGERPPNVFVEPDAGLRGRNRNRGLRRRFGCSRRWIRGWKGLMRLVW
jgi:hypothetical protein